MHDTGCLGLVHWDDPEGWNGEGTATKHHQLGGLNQHKGHSAGGWESETTDAWRAALPLEAGGGNAPCLFGWLLVHGSITSNPVSFYTWFFVWPSSLYLCQVPPVLSPVRIPVTGLGKDSAQHQRWNTGSYHSMRT